MKNSITLTLVMLSGLLLSACTESLDPLSPGSTDGKFALGVKALIPLAIGNHWTYSVVVYDTSGAEKARYTYDLSVVDTVTADTGKIPLVPPSTNRKSLSREALVWFLLRGEGGVVMCSQVDSLESLRFRKADDTRFYEQTAFDFRASIGDASPQRYLGPDTTTWASGDIFITAADSVQSTLVSKGVDTLRTTLGSAPYFQYRQSYAKRGDFVDYIFKPGFGLVLMETFRKKVNGTTVRVRRDELVSYYFR